VYRFGCMCQPSIVRMRSGLSPVGRWDRDAGWTPGIWKSARRVPFQLLRPPYFLQGSIGSSWLEVGGWRLQSRHRLVHSYSGGRSGHETCRPRPDPQPGSDQSQMGSRDAGPLLVRDRFRPGPDRPDRRSFVRRRSVGRQYCCAWHWNRGRPDGPWQPDPRQLSCRDPAAQLPVPPSVRNRPRRAGRCRPST